jgi:hypothetical protein
MCCLLSILECVCPCAAQVVAVTGSGVPLVQRQCCPGAAGGATVRPTLPARQRHRVRSCVVWAALLPEPPNRSAAGSAVASWQRSSRHLQLQVLSLRYCYFTLLFREVLPSEDQGPLERRFTVRDFTRSALFFWNLAASATTLRILKYSNYDLISLVLCQLF